MLDGLDVLMLLVFFGMLVISGILGLILMAILNPIWCLFSKSARYRRWNGYTGIFYIDKPLMTTKGYRVSEYLKENNVDIHKEIEKSKTGDSEYFIEPNVLKPMPHLEPTDEELGWGIHLPFSKLKFIHKLSPTYWIPRMFKKR